MAKLNIVSSRQKKSQLTKDAILQAAVKLMKKYNYDSLTVRNICELAQVSTGTFYHHFATRENLLAYYLTEDYKKFEANYYEGRDMSSINECDRVIDIYVCCAEYSELKGVEFIAGFYSTKNKSLLPPEDSKNGTPNSAFTPIFEKTIKWLTTAQQNGMLNEEVTPYSISYDLCVLFNGIVYEWCLSEATLPLQPYIRKMFGMYLNNVITAKFIDAHGKFKFL